MQALSKFDDTILIKFDAINRLNKSLNDLLTAESIAFDTVRISRMTTEFFDQPIFVTGEQIDDKKIEENIVRSILNDEEIEFPTDTDHICLTNRAEEINQQSIDKNKLFIETELIKNERDVETLENSIYDAKRDLIKTFTDPSDSMIFDNVINVNDWVNKTDNKKLDQNIRQNYNEIASEMLANNVDLLSQMVSKNEIRDSLILEKINAQKEHENKQLVEKIQPDLDVYIRDDNELVELTEINDSSLNQRRSKALAELNRKTKHEAKIEKRSSKPYLKNKKKLYKIV